MKGSFLIAVLLMCGMVAVRKSPSIFVEEEKCHHGGDSTGCYIEVLDDLPSVPAKATARVFYAEAGIELGSFNTAKTDDFHTGITMVWDTGVSMTFQWYALKGMKSALVPVPSSTGVNWLNEAKLVYSDNIDSTYWSNQTLLGEISGDGWGEFSEFLVKYASNFTRYLLWQVMTPSGEMLVNDAICDTFTESAIRNLFDGKLASLPHIKRNYGIMYALKVDKFDTSDWMEVAKMGLFYKRLAQTVEEAGKNPRIALEGLVKGHAVGKKPIVYIGGYTGGVFYKIALVPPYMENRYSYMFPAHIIAKSGV